MRELLDGLLVESLDELGYPRDISTYKVIIKNTVGISMIRNTQGNASLEEFLEDIRSTFKSESENQVQIDFTFHNQFKKHSTTKFQF